MPPRSDSAQRGPHPALKGLVESYTGTSLTGCTPGIHLGTPSLTLPLIMSLRDHPVVQLQSRTGADRVAYQGLVAGLQLAPVLIDHASSAMTLTVELTPRGLTELFGARPSDWFGVSVHAADALGRSVEELRQRVEFLDGWPARFAAVDAYLLALRRDRRSAPTLADRAWRTIRATGGGLTVEQLAGQLGTSRRTLQSCLVSQLGVGPKALSRVARFGRARELVHARLQHRAPEPTLAAIAARVGYADEAHLIRDWRLFTGCTPIRWRDVDAFAFSD
ncbi:helix-turn-helix domain-containing protein [Microlunatus sp. GCM10028923]|uniref:helix-turn-helix domain-containing protein n=1 Tax=Microlunatus sp. GCM10028923 TaxID=3273400 RepID=UPI00360EF815